MAEGGGDAARRSSAASPAACWIAERQWLCRSDALVDGRRSVGFDVAVDGHVQRAFAIRHDGRAAAYLNRCAHVPVEMDWQPGEFFDDTGRWLVCSIHGATYRPHDGLCVSGPCPGRRLQAVPLREAGAQVWWLPTARIRPVGGDAVGPSAHGSIGDDAGPRERPPA